MLASEFYDNLLEYHLSFSYHLCEQMKTQNYFLNTENHQLKDGTLKNRLYFLHSFFSVKLLNLGQVKNEFEKKNYFPFQKNYKNLTMATFSKKKSTEIFSQKQHNEIYSALDSRRVYN